ncbi:MAG TPA: universal stress protein [Solirubrobacterales bacterium]|nr:universal stress protein [Solirubrobacterales bacterium]
MFRNILVAIDGSETAGRALQTAAELAEALNSRMTIIAVAQGVPSFAYRGGVDVGALEREARDEMDKLVRESVGSRGRGRVATSLFGSVGAYVHYHAHVPTLVIHQED